MANKIITYSPFFIWANIFNKKEDKIIFYIIKDLKGGT
jgi:hypothetical protein